MPVRPRPAPQPGRAFAVARIVDKTHPALQQAALLHDVAKAGAGLTLLHRVAVVLLKESGARTCWRGPGRMVRSRREGNLRYPFWAHAHHPETRGAGVAAGAGCDPLAAVELIRRHQETDRGAAEPHWGSARAGGQRSRRDIDLLLTALRTADDDN